MYNNQTLQINPHHHGEESQNTNSHKTPGRQLKQSNLLSLPLQDDFKTRKNSKYCHKTKVLEELHTQASSYIYSWHSEQQDISNTDKQHTHARTSKNTI